MKLIEKHVNEKQERVYIKRGFVLERRRREEGEVVGLLVSIQALLRSVFLPEGYPDSVSKDYIYYQGWDTVQAFASSISGSLATSAVLQGVGVGDETASPLAATLTWILRDGTGMVGRILFAAKCGTRLDYDCKKWRLCADILNDLAMLMEIVTPRFGREWTLAVLCIASLSRSIVGVAGGATKAAVAQHQAKRNNMADLSAKDGSQETMVNLLALLVNLLLLPRIANYPDLVMPLFSALTVLHIFANYKAVRSLEFDTLNGARLNVVLESFFAGRKVRTVQEVNQQESLAFSFRSDKIQFGASIANLKGEPDFQLMSDALTENRPYFLVSRPNDHVLVFLADSATGRDLLRAYIDAWIRSHQLKGDEQLYSLLERLKQAGWCTDRLAIQTQGFLFVGEK